MKHSYSLTVLSASEPARPAKRLKAADTPTSPFPDFDHPKVEESREVIHLLHSEFPQIQAYRNNHTTKRFQASPCSGVTDVIEAFIKTVLFESTSANNSSAAKWNLDTIFRRNGFAAIAQAPCSQLVDAIRTAGLMNRKAATIQKLINSIHAQHGSYSFQHLAGGGHSDEDAVGFL